MKIKFSCGVIHVGGCLDILPTLPDNSVHCCITSPPYFGLRDYGTGTWDGGDPECDHVELKITADHSKYRTSTLGVGNYRNPPTNPAYRSKTTHYKGECRKCGARRQDAQLGNEATPEEYVANMVKVFREVRRVLRDDGTLWLNVGDSYCVSSRSAGASLKSTLATRPTANKTTMLREQGARRSPVPKGVKEGDLIGVPWLLAFALRADGWYLRGDNIWCLSGGAWLYAKTQKGEMPMLIKDMVRLRPDTVQLWNGTKWTQVLGWGKNPDPQGKIELVLRSGERIGCTGDHLWPTQRGNIKASDLQVGDVIQTCRLPDSEKEAPAYLTEDVMRFVGLYIAEGSHCGDVIQLSLHADEVKWVKWLRRLAVHYGGSLGYTVKGNILSVRIRSRALNAILDTYVGGRVSHDKYLKVAMWRLPNRMLRCLARGYLQGDGSLDKANNRWRIGFCRNYSLERDLRSLAARLGAKIKLVPCVSKDQFGNQHAAFRGEWRWKVSDHGNVKNSGEIVEIRKSRAREFWDIAVADEPHLFSLASGVLTHNCKPNPMPESVSNRCSKNHEYLFLLTKKRRYYYDAVAVQEKSKGGAKFNKPTGAYSGRGDVDSPGNPDLAEIRNKRSVWTVATKAFKGAHFAVMPDLLVRPCVLAGTSEKGCCVKCGAPWRRVVEKVRNATRPGKDTKVAGTNQDTHGNRDPRRHVTRVVTKGWEATCKCKAGVKPCVILDPFHGAGTTAKVAVLKNRHFVGIELNPEYAELSRKRINKAIMNRGFGL